MSRSAGPRYTGLNKGRRLDPQGYLPNRNIYKYTCILRGREERPDYLPVAAKYQPGVARAPEQLWLLPALPNAEAGAGSRGKTEASGV